MDAGDNCGSRPAVAVEVFGDEDDQTPTAPREVHAPDAREIAPGRLLLRAERVGRGDGRVYLILSRATDAAGNRAHACSTVVVPRSLAECDRRRVQEQAAAARTFCRAHGAPPPGFFVIGERR